MRAGAPDVVRPGLPAMGTIHDSITTPDRAEAVKEVMVEEFRRFGPKPTIHLES